jgi:hypothetical protein
MQILTMREVYEAGPRRCHHPKCGERIRRRLYHRPRFQPVELPERSGVSDHRLLDPLSLARFRPGQPAGSAVAEAGSGSDGKNGFRYEGYHNSGFKPKSNDSYILIRSRLQLNIAALNMVQSGCPAPGCAAVSCRNRRYGPPNLNAWDLKLAYAEFGDPEKHWISVRVGRQLINYNNTIIANSEWRNQGRSYDAAVANLHYSRYRLGLFAASVVVPLAEGISHHQEGNNIYGAYGGIDHIISQLRAGAIPALARAAERGDRDHRQNQDRKQDEWAPGFRFKGTTLKNLEYSTEFVMERGNDGPNDIDAWGHDRRRRIQIRLALVKAAPFLPVRLRFRATRTRLTECTGHSTRCIRRLTTASASPTSSAGRTSSPTAPAITIEPRHRWTVTAQWLDFWLASPRTRSTTHPAGRSFAIRREITGHISVRKATFTTWYELNRHVNVGVGVGTSGVRSSSRGRPKTRTTTTPTSRLTSRMTELPDNLADPNWTGAATCDVMNLAAPLAPA